MTRLLTVFLQSAFLLAILGCGSYKIRDKEVYWTSWNEGAGSTEKIISDAHYATFKFLKHDRYAKDTFRAFYKGYSIEGADPSTFESLHTFFAADKNSGFYGSQVIPDSDGKTFEFVEGNWSKDANEYYYMTKAIGVCDKDSFEITDIDSDWWAVDRECVYYQSYKVPVNDRGSVKLLKHGYATDKMGVYFQNKQLVGADPKTFTVDGILTARDKNACYFMEEITDCPSQIRSKQ